jgi:hypothetical protein
MVTILLGLLAGKEIKPRNQVLPVSMTVRESA